MVIVAGRSTQSLGVIVASSSKSRAVIRAFASFALLLVLGTIALGADDQSIKGVAAAFAVILGVPFVLLSLIDLGGILRVEAGGDYQATKAAWLLSHLQAAFGATCMAAAGYATYYNVTTWLNGTAKFHGAVLLLSVPMGVALIVVGIDYVWSAFVPARPEGANDT
jgi:hypothetical protein